jgi:hypothetical protein
MGRLNNEFDFDDYRDYRETTHYQNERQYARRYDHLPNYNDSYYDSYYDDEEEEEEDILTLLGPKIFWIKLIQRHWKKTFNSNKCFKGMLSIYKL